MQCILRAGGVYSRKYPRIERLASKMQSEDMYFRLPRTESGMPKILASKKKLSSWKNMVIPITDYIGKHAHF